MECADRLDMLDILSKEALEGRRGDDLLVFLRESGGDRLLQEHIISTRDPVRRSVLTAAFLGAVALEEDFNLRVQEDLFKFTIRYFIAHGGELLLPLARFPLVDQSSYFIDSIAAPPASCAGEYTVRDFPRLAACWKLIHPSARAGGFNNYFTARAVMLSNNSLWVRWFAALVSPSPDISELAKQVT